MKDRYEALLEEYPDSLPVSVAAKTMGKPSNWLYMGIEHGTLPFGSYARDKRCSFHISTQAFVRYMRGDLMTPSREIIDKAAEAAAKAVIREFKGAC